MTLAELEQLIEKKELTKEQEEKLKLQRSAAKAIAGEIKKTLEPMSIKKVERDFIESQNLQNSLFELINYAVALHCEVSHRVRTKNLMPFKNKKATDLEQVNLYRTLSKALFEIIEKEPEGDFILLQDVIIKHHDVLCKKLNIDVQV